MQKTKQKHYTVYKITNNINGKIYVGKHETFDVNDSYTGSGKHLRRSIKKHGVENFTKDILYDFDNRKEMNLMEAKLVDEEFVKRKDTYNITLGGQGGGYHTKGKFTVRDKDGNTLQVSKTDLRVLSGELVSIEKGRVVVRDRHNNRFITTVDDPLYKDGELVPVNRGRVRVKDRDGSIFMTTVDDLKYINGELIQVHTDKGTVLVKDKYGNRFTTTINDPNYLSGELSRVFTAKGTHHSDESKRKIGEANSIHQTGTGNNQYGTCWIFNLDLQENKKIPKDNLDDWVSRGWIKGRKTEFYQCRKDN